MEASNSPGECLENLQPETTPASPEADGGVPLPTLFELLEQFAPRSSSPIATLGGPGGLKCVGISDLVSEIKCLQLRRTINRSIIKCRDGEAALQVCRELRDSITRNRHWSTSGFVAFVPHLSSIPHVHIWHDCNPIQSMCRCRIIQQYRTKTGPAFLATRESVRSFRPLRGIPTEDEKKETGQFYSNLLRYLIIIYVNFKIMIFYL